MAGDDVDVTVRKYRLRTVWFGIVKTKASPDSGGSFLPHSPENR